MFPLFGKTNEVLASFVKMLFVKHSKILNSFVTKMPPFLPTKKHFRLISKRRLVDKGDDVEEEEVEEEYLPKGFISCGVRRIFIS